MRVKPANIALLVCLVTGLLSFINKRDDGALDKLIANLQHFTDSIPQEKVYLHLDKPYYALGDTIWFKGYVTVGSRHQLSALSGAVYVDLINDKDSIVRDLKLPVTSGMVVGNFILGDDYTEGSYRIRAYTQWMRNAGPDYFYDHTFTVGDIGNRSLITKADYQYKDINGKQVLTALLNFTNDEGKAVAERPVRYEIVINKKTVWAQNVTTDPLGSIKVDINNDNKTDLAGAYIRATVNGVGDYPIVRDFPIKATLSQSDVQFFPESGNLVTGINSKIAFKAVGVNGLGLNIKGTIVDDTGKEQAKFETLHAGMGSFMLRPMPGKSYTAKISSADGTTKDIALPKANTDGYTLGIYQPNKDSVLVRINASQGLLTQPKGLNLIVQSGGESIFTSAIKIEKAVTSIWLDKKDFPGGIAQFTLFDDKGEPLNERLAFIRGSDKMQLAIKSNKTVYGSKERVQISLDAKDSKGKPTFGNFSVSVIDETKLPFDENKESTIFTNLLLTSDLKGYIEQPNYYFINETDEVNRALDNLMLTQGYRRFAWKDLANTVNQKPAFKVEQLGTTISGRVTTLTDQLLPKAAVSLISPRAKIFKDAKTDSSGRFLFDGIFLTDSIKFSLQARNGKSDKVKLILDSVPKLTVGSNPNLPNVSTDIAQTLKTYITNGKKLDDYYEKTGQMDKVQRLREVRIRAKKNTALEFKHTGIVIPAGSADHSYKFPNTEPCATLGICLQGNLPGIIFKEYIYREGRDSIETLFPNYPYCRQGTNVSPMLRVVLDGQLITDRQQIGDMFNSNTLDPADIIKVETARTNNALVSMLGGASLIIYTNRGQPRKYYNPSVANINPKGFNKVREFYQPRYDKPGNADKLPDTRTTVYWDPYLKTNANGTTTFNYFNADGPGTYKVIIEGINADGELGRQVYRYTVDGSTVEQPAPVLLPDSNKMGYITQPFNYFNKRLPVEKVYLQTDKPYYNMGDTLWFKAYIVNGTDLKPSRMSGLLYVELNDDTLSNVRRVSLRIKDGMTWGQIPLTKKIFREGALTLRAYTNWMQNYGDDYLFSQPIYLGTTSNVKWLVTQESSIKKVGLQDEVQVEIKLNRIDKLFSPVALKKIQVRLFDDWHYIYDEDHQTGIDGSIKFSQLLKEKTDVSNMHVQIKSLEKADKEKTVQVPLTLVKKVDLQFLPESGNLVAGLQNTIAFKALADNGKGTPVSGDIVDAAGKQVAAFATLHNGMGRFEFTPQAGQKYTARLTQPNKQTFELPVVKPTGTVLHIKNPEKSEVLSVSVRHTADVSLNDSCYLVGTSRGMIYYSAAVNPNQPDIAIAKNLFPTGIARFTLFKGKRPVNERRVFIDNDDGLSIKVTPHKTTFNRRDSINLAIEVKDKQGFPVKGNFSLSVTDDEQVNADTLGNNDIITNLLLNTELKGYIENPGYYINRRSAQAWQALDNLLLTQGWTGYLWNDVFSLPEKPKFEAEKTMMITGLVSNVSKKPLPDNEVIISSQKPFFISSTRTDANGIYTFKDLPLIDSGSFFIQANNKNGSKKTFGNINVKNFIAPAVAPYKQPVVPWYINTDSAMIMALKRKMQKEDELQLKGNVLKEVVIKRQKIIKDSFLWGDADFTYDEQDIKESAVLNIYELLKQKIPGFKVVNNYGKGYNGIAMTMKGGMRVTILIDGWPLPLHIDNPYSTEELIEEISKTMAVTLKGLQINVFPGDARLPPAIHAELTTKNGRGWYRLPKTGTVTYRPLPVMYPQQFYSPKYNVKQLVTEADYRSTIFWEPNIFTDAEGKAQVSFYNSDSANKYTVKIAGTDANGNLGDATIKLNERRQVP